MSKIKAAIIHHKFFENVNRFFLLQNKKDTMVGFIRADLVPDCYMLGSKSFAVDEMDEDETQEYMLHHFEDSQYLKVLDLDDNCYIQISKKGAIDYDL